MPPYVGPRGWLGVELDKGLDWRTVATRVREAYEKVAPASLARSIGDTIVIEPPTETVPDVDFDPLLAPHARERLEALRRICLALPETSEAKQFGTPAFKAGKKTFCGAHRYGERMHMEFWVGRDRQAITRRPLLMHGAGRRTRRSDAACADAEPRMARSGCPARQQVRTPHRLTLVCRARTPRRPGPQRNLDLSFAAD